MVKKAEVTEEDVLKACDELVQGGMKPGAITCRDLRDHIGRGSNTTMSAGHKLYMQRLKADEAAQCLVPEASMADLQRLFAQAVASATQTERNRHELELGAAMEQGAEANERSERLDAEVKRLELEVDQLQEKLDEADALNVELSGKLQAEAAIAATLRAELRNLYRTLAQPSYATKGILMAKALTDAKQARGRGTA
jgi:hypothetical protein